MSEQLALFNDLSGAVFSDCMLYRYNLWRVWNQEAPRLLWCMLNPSTADHTKNDPTIRRCIDFSKRLGFGSTEIVNIFAFRSTDPKLLFTQLDPIGVKNDAAIRTARARCSKVICAWGEHGVLLDRGARVNELLKEFGPVFCLKRNTSGAPGHPLYIKGDTQPIEYLG